MLATLGFATLLLPPANQLQAMRSAAFAFGFAANVFFQLAPSGYFDPASGQAPLLHLWSLGVEEQFYLAWPVVLLLARKRPALALAVIAVGSFVLANLLATKAAFYGTPARAWELAVGGLVALRPLRLPRGAGWVGLGLVLVACCVPMPRFPGVGALPAVLGAALLIAAIRNGERNALLESRPMVAVGLISYSLYLWHWPLLVLGKRMELSPLLLVALAFVLATLSYRFVESPIRIRKSHPRWAVGCAVLLLACGGVAAGTRAYQLDSTMPLPSIYAMGCDDWFHSVDVKPCAFGPKDARRTAVIMGDSVGLQWFPAWAEVFRGWRIIALTKSSCPMVDAPLYYPKLGREYTECAAWRKAALERVVAMHPDVLVLGSAYNYPLTAGQWASGTRSVLATVRAVPRVLIVRATPLTDSNPGRSRIRSASVFRAITAAATPYGNTALLDMDETVCPGGSCRIARPGCTIFRDETHLTPTYARSLAPELARQAGIPYDGRPECSW
jgi:hypothetical protein